ncbi:MAG TPA: trypsin-like peptidase domain-containing protein [Candidatus Limnocylindrales bacterium]|nr:trypsin-like peptidase domain-containing protein [Candidatus Limnocylindrales bacterium]
MSVGRALGPVAALVASAALGGLVAVGAVAVFGGGLGGETTVVTETSMARGPGLAPANTTGLSVNEIYQRAAPGVVRVNATTNSTAFGPHVPSDQFPTTPRASSLGSGFVIDKAGHIVTNYHVVEGAGEVTVSFSNRDTVKAEIVGTDPSTDLALLRVDASASALTPLPLGNSDRVVVGDPVVAIGNPFGLDRTVTSGIVSAVQRLITAPNRFTIDHVIQTDAAINHGNSGGPLLNSRGQVIGVNSQIETGDTATGNVGVGFSVPSNTVKDVVAQILRTGHVDHAYLGISGQAVTPDVADKYNLAVSRGVIVESVTSESGADKAGLRAGKTRVVMAGETFVLGGDIIVSFDGKKISTIEELRDAVAAHKPGDKVKVVIFRGANRTSVTVTLGRQPPSPQG